jgi:hypothetical protein
MARHLRPTPTHLRVRRAVTVPVVALAALSLAAPAMAAKPARNASSSTLKLVLLSSTDGLPHQGQDITFEASSSATTEPHVRLSCAQGGVVVYTAQTGYYASYPWPWTNTMNLSSGAWTGGAADCTATLYWFNGSKTVTGTTLPFHVEA